MNFRARILVVDDRNENRLLVTRILNQQDYEVITAASGLEALQFLEHDPNIDVMLLDMMMPDLKGFEVLEAIQTNPHTSRIKVIMFSAMGHVEDKVKAFESGAADYIVKPFNRIELLARIELQLKLSRIEKELSTERNLLRLLIDNLPDLIYVKDIHSRFVAANVALAKIIGVATPAELIGQTDFDFFPRQLASQYYADEQTLIRTGQSLQAREEPVVDATGRSGWILTTKVPLTDTSGNVFGLVGIGRDITERKHIEETLQQNEELLSNIIESMGDGILVLDTQFRYTYWNRAMEEISKVSRREVIGNEQAPWEIFPRLIERGVDKAMRRAMQGETIHLREIPSYFKDGSSEFTSEIVTIQAKSLVENTNRILTKNKR